MAEVYTTPEGKASFCYLVEPNSDDKYQLTLLLPPDTDVDELWEIVDELLHEEFGEDVPDDLNYPITTAGEINRRRERKGKKIWDGYEDDDTIVVKFSSRDAPGLVNEDNELVPKPNKRDWYSGMLCRPVFTASYYDTSGNEGVGFWLQAVQRTGEGDRFQGEKIDPTEYLTPIGGRKRGGRRREERPRGRRTRDDEVPRTRSSRRRDDERGDRRRGRR